MAKEYVPIFFDWLETTQDLNAEEKGNLIDAVVSYAAGKEYEHLLTGNSKIAFRFLKGQVDRNKAISEARAKAGSTRNKPEENETNGSKSEQTETNDNDRQRPITVETSDKLPEVKGFMDDAEAQAIQGEHDRILDAAKDAGFKGTNTENAALIQLYTQYGLQKMLDGFASCVEHSAPNLAYLRAVLKGEPRKQTGKVLPAQNFSQRDYTEVEKEMQERQRERIIEIICRNNGLWDEANNKPVEGWREKMDQLKAEGKAV